MINTLKLDGNVIDIDTGSVFEIIKLVNTPVFYRGEEIKRKVFNLLKMLSFLLDLDKDVRHNFLR